MFAEHYPMEHAFRNLISHLQKPDTPADDVPLADDDLALENACPIWQAEGYHG
ncbi:MAG: hypothetical protein STSR0007_12200 [Thermovirga sp.]